MIKLTHPSSGDSHDRETFLAPSGDNQIIYIMKSYIYIYIYKFFYALLNEMSDGKKLAKKHTKTKNNYNENYLKTMKISNAELNL